MIEGIHAVVKQYAQNGKEYEEWTYNPSNRRGIYEKLMELTDNDHEISDEAASWCEQASVGERYEFREGEIEIREM